MSRNLTTDDVKTIYELVSKLSPEWTDTFAVDDSEGEEKPKKLSLEQLKSLFTPYNGAENDVDLGDKIIEARKGLFGNIVNNLTTTDEGYIADARQLKVLKDLVDELKGIGWTDETLASLGLRLATLEGTGSGSVQEQIQIAIDSHVEEQMPHVIENLATGKRYRYGIRVNEKGHPQMIYEEIV